MNSPVLTYYDLGPHAVAFSTTRHGGVYYEVKVEYKSADARDLRFYYEWNRKTGIESVLDDLNQFAKVNITLNNKKITVE